MKRFNRIVFDTSTLVSAALRVGSIPHKALAHALGCGEVCVSAETLRELETVLMRPKFDRYQPVDVRKAFFNLIRKYAVFFAVTAEDESMVIPPCRDSKDNSFLALVLACEADVLVSSDADLLVLHPWQSVPVITPANFLLTTHTGAR